MFKHLTPIRKHISDNWYFYILIIPLAIFAKSIFDGRYYIGGDVTIPIEPLNNLKKLELWYSGKESLHFLHTLWYLYYSIFPLFGLSSEFGQKVLILIGYLSGFVSTYLLHKDLFKGKKYGHKRWAYLSAVTFTFNPVHILLPPAYLPIYGFPTCLYLVQKSIKNNNIAYPVLFSILLNFFFFVDLPQPKLLLVFGYTTMILLALIKITSPITLKSLIKRTVYLVLISLSLNLWIFIPLARSTFSGLISSFGSAVPSQNGMADFGSSALVYISRFYNHSLIENYPHLNRFLTNPAFILWSMFSWSLIVIGYLLQKNKTKLQEIFTYLILLGIPIIWLAKGPNPPLGSLYVSIIKNIPIARVFRTTASVSSGAVLFYSFLLSLSVFSLQAIMKKKLFSYFVVIHLLIYSPLILGHQYYNSIYTDPTTRGVSIPEEYFDMADRIEKLDSDARIIPIPSVEGYVSKKWHYFGPDIITWMTDADFTTSPTVYGLNNKDEKTELSRLISANASHILIQKDTANEIPTSLNDYGKIIHTDSQFDLYKINKQQGIDRFYSSTPGISPNIDSRQISATRYELTITSDGREFYLSHAETYDPGWGLFFDSRALLSTPISVWLNRPVVTNTPENNSVPWPQNHWEINPSLLCKQKNASCIHNADDTYLIKLIVDYWPQQLFYLSILLSAVSSILILSYTYLHRREYEIPKK